MKKVLIANRGEIAVRIIQACRDHGLNSVAVYADADADAVFVSRADEAYALQGDTPAQTYLDIDKLIAVARRAGADAIHPGYGFLSERPEFARRVMDEGLIWIGPKPEVIEALGDKVRARQIAKQVGAPLVAGSDGPVSSPQDVTDFAKEHGYPVAIKAAHGGGGRGMKVVWKAEDADELYHSAVREATAAFGRGECYVEQFLDRPRHVEAQVIADMQGNVVVVGTRDCSLQRRNQKLVEEAPAPFLSDDQRHKIHDAATAICRQAGYTGVGTVEFLLGINGVITFLEVNTRLQVEHPVTEETTGLDLVIEQLRIAQGLPLAITEIPQPCSHAIEFRINAEDVGRGFLPSAGLIKRFEPPSGIGVRLDSGVVSGSHIAPMFDSMMAKLIIRGRNRDEALSRARRALGEFVIEGVGSVLPFHRLVVNHPDFTAKDGFRVHTRWIETDFAESLDMAMRSIPADNAMTRCAIEIDQKRVELGLPASFFRLFGAANTGPHENAPNKPDEADRNMVAAPVSGTLHSWLVEDGATVEEGATIAVMEAMKMETMVSAPLAGKIKILAQAGSIQPAGNAIARIGL